MNDPEKNAQQTRDKAASKAESVRQKAQEEGQKLAGTVNELGQARAEQTFEKGKVEAEHQVDAVQAAVDDAAHRLEEEGHPFASYASELSGQLSTLSSRIESASLDDLVRDGRRVSRENPGLFMLGAVAVGFAASRFLKASEQRSESDYADLSSDDSYEDDADDYAYARASGTPYRPAQPYRRAPRPPVTPVPRDSGMSTGAVAGTSAPVGSSTGSTGTSAGVSANTGTSASTTTPRVNPPVNDRDDGKSTSTSTVI